MRACVHACVSMKELERLGGALLLETQCACRSLNEARTLRVNRTLLICGIHYIARIDRWRLASMIMARISHAGVLCRIKHRPCVSAANATDSEINNLYVRVCMRISLSVSLSLFLSLLCLRYHDRFEKYDTYL